MAITEMTGKRAQSVLEQSTANAMAIPGKPAKQSLADQPTVAMPCVECAGKDKRIAKLEHENALLRSQAVSREAEILANSVSIQPANDQPVSTSDANALLTVSKTDRKAYQRDLMRKRRAQAKALPS